MHAKKYSGKAKDSKARDWPAEAKVMPESTKPTGIATEAHLAKFLSFPPVVSVSYCAPATLTSYATRACTDLPRPLSLPPLV